METMELDRLVEAATSHLDPSERINLAKSTWLAGQFLGEMCDYEPGKSLAKTYISRQTYEMTNHHIRIVIDNSYVRKAGKYTVHLEMVSSEITINKLK